MADSTAHNNSSGSEETVHENYDTDVNALPTVSLAGSRHPLNQNQVYLSSDYARLNPQYRDKSNDEPVWSLAQPLPHVVRNGMRRDEASEDEKHHPREGHDRPDMTEQGQAEPAAAEPPAPVPPDNEEEAGKLEAAKSTTDNREFFNTWGRIRDFARRELAEWLGVTVALTLGLCAGLSTYTSQNQAGSFGSLAAAWGFAFMTSIYLAGGVSGGHLNPAITISMAVWRGFPTRRCAGYILAQTLGAITASGIAYAIYHGSIVNVAAMSNVPQNQSPAKDAMVTLPKEFVKPAPAFFNEFLGSAILFGVILALGDDSNAPPGAGMQAFIIGVIITVLILALGYTTGGCFNPARDFGGRAVAAMAGWGGQLFTEYHAWWIWGPWVADISGALFGGFMYDLIIFTGGESPVNYPPKRMKRALALKERDLRAKLHLGQHKVPDLERAAQDYEQ